MTWEFIRTTNNRYNYGECAIPKPHRKRDRVMLREA
jgi:hypothetical protein